MPETHPAAFISYCRDDQEFALRLAQDLKAAGAAVWLDQLDIKPGSSWDNAVEDALLAANQMLVILSPTSVKSENVRDEISYALTQGKTVIPVLYMECVIPLRLERKQHIDFRADYARGLATLLNQLHVDKPNQAVLDKAAEGDAQRHLAWQAREAETERRRLEEKLAQEAGPAPILSRHSERSEESQYLPLNPAIQPPVAQTASPMLWPWFIGGASAIGVLIVGLVVLHKSPSTEVDKAPQTTMPALRPTPLQASGNPSNPTVIDRVEGTQESLTNPGYETYTNGRYGFRIDYPKSFRKQPPPANGDGSAFHSDDGRAVLSTFGMNNSAESLQDRYQLAIRSIHGTLGYNTTGKNWFVVTSTDGTTNFYTKEFVGPASINAFTMTFPADQPEYDGTVTAIEKSFRPGATQLSH